MGLFGLEFSKNNRLPDLIVILLINCLKILILILFELG